MNKDVPVGVAYKNAEGLIVVNLPKQCGSGGGPRSNRMNENTKKMWADPRFQLLADLDRLLDSSKIWGGMEWVYHPIHPAKYRPMAERVRAELGKLYTEYGVEE